MKYITKFIFTFHGLFIDIFYFCFQEQDTEVVQDMEVDRDTKVDQDIEVESLLGKLLKEIKPNLYLEPIFYIKNKITY